jgi:hypothetical protein
VLIASTTVAEFVGRSGADTVRVRSPQLDTLRRVIIDAGLTAEADHGSALLVRGAAIEVIGDLAARKCDHAARAERCRRPRSKVGAVDGRRGRGAQHRSGRTAAGDRIGCVAAAAGKGGDGGSGVRSAGVDGSCRDDGDR